MLILVSRLCNFDHLTKAASAKDRSWVFFNIYLFLAPLGLRCYGRQTFSSCSKLEPLFLVCGLLTAVASLVASTGSGRGGFRSCRRECSSFRLQCFQPEGSRAQSQ